MEDEQHNPFAAPSHHASNFPRTGSPFSTRQLIFFSVLFAAGVTIASFTSLGRSVKITSGGDVATVLGSGLAVAAIALGVCRGLKAAIYPAQLLNLTTWLTMCLTAIISMIWLKIPMLSWDDIQIFGSIWLAGIVVVSAIVWLGSIFHKQPDSPGDQTTDQH